MAVRRYMVELAAEFNVTRKRLPAKRMQVFDGQRVLFETSPWGLVSAGKLLWR